MQTTIIKPGQWRHCKGNIYTVLGVAELGDLNQSWPNLNCEIFSLEEDPNIHLFGQNVGGKLWYRPILGAQDYGDRVLYFNNAGHWARTVESFFGTKDGQPRFTEL